MKIDFHLGKNGPSPNRQELIWTSLLPKPNTGEEFGSGVSRTRK
jgi:hypothetical protein